MTISTRTPDGLPFRCPVCGKESAQWPCLPEGAALCPHCGCLIWLSWLQNYLSEMTGVAPENITPETRFDELGADSLDIVEMVMQLEDEWGFTIPDEDAKQIKTLDDLMRRLDEYFRRKYLD